MPSTVVFARYSIAVGGSIMTPCGMTSYKLYYVFMYVLCMYVSIHVYVCVCKYNPSIICNFNKCKIMIPYGFLKHPVIYPSSITLPPYCPPSSPLKALPPPFLFSPFMALVFRYLSPPLLVPHTTTVPFHFPGFCSHSKL